MVSTINGLQHRERDVRQLNVVIEDQRTTDGGQVGCSEVLEKVLVETHGPVHSTERWQFDVAAVAESHVVSPLQVGEGSGKMPAVGLNRKRLADVSQLRLNLSQIKVVVDVERLHGLKVDTIQGSELCVGDQNVGGSRDLGGEGNVLQVWQSVPHDTVHHAEAGKGERGKDGHVCQLEAFVDDRQTIRGKGGQLGRTIGNEIAGDSLDAIELNGIGSRCGDDDVATESCTAGQSRRIAAILDRRRWLTTLSCNSRNKY